MKKFIALLLITSSLNSWAQSNPCKNLNIYADGISREFVKLSIIDKESLKIQLCDYQNPKLCRAIGNSTTYKMKSPEYLKIKEHAKGALKLILEAEATLGMAFLGGMTGLLLSANEGGQAAGIVSALTVGGTGYVINTSKILNPLENFRNAVAIKEISENLRLNNCNMSVELSENELEERMKDLVEIL